jgi:hypothetical protein
MLFNKLCEFSSKKPLIWLFFHLIKKKIHLATKNEEVKNMPLKKFLNMSFESNPIMQEDRAKFMVARKREMQIKAFEKEH